MRERNSNPVLLLEQLATTAHHFFVRNDLLDSQSTEIKQAFDNNDATFMRYQISDIESFAHESHVIQSLIYDFNDLCNFKFKK